MQIFYVKAEEKVELEKKDIRFADVANVLCEEDRIQREAQELPVCRFSKEGRTVIDVLQLIALLQEAFPGCQVVSLGSDAVLVEYHVIKPHPVWEKVKIALIALLSFFGAAFTIMAFHNDISIDDIFSKVYRLVTGLESDGLTVLEISYSVGLSAGIILFFNHIGTRRITKDPTPIEVQMRQYEGDVVTALVENANRESANAESTTNRKSVNAESTANRKSANAESTANRENANAESTANRENVNAESAGGREKEPDTGGGRQQ